MSASPIFSHGGVLVFAPEIGANLRAAASPRTACAEHCLPVGIKLCIVAAHSHCGQFSSRPKIIARFSFCRGCEGRKGVWMSSWPRNALMEKIAGFAVTLATRIQRAPNGSALPRSHSSELPTQPKAFAPKTRWLRHPLTEKRAGFAVALATRIQRAPNGSALLRSHRSELPPPLLVRRFGHVV